MTDASERSAIDRSLRWVFEDRTTGRITIAQMPNLPLWGFILTWAVRTFLNLPGRVGTIVFGLGLVCLTIWAADETLRGVNPWRRFLGVAAMAYVLYQFLRSAELFLHTP